MFENCSFYVSTLGNWLPTTFNCSATISAIAWINFLAKIVLRFLLPFWGFPQKFVFYARGVPLAFPTTVEKKVTEFIRTLGSNNDRLCFYLFRKLCLHLQNLFAIWWFNFFVDSSYSFVRFTFCDPNLHEFGAAVTKIGLFH